MTTDMLRCCSLILISTILLHSFTLPHKEKVKQVVKHGNTKYLYKIGNGTDRDINFYLSPDSLKWQKFTVEMGFQSKEYFDYEKMYFKVDTRPNVFVVYRIKGNQSYKIYYNRSINKFDLVYFVPYLNYF